MLPRNVHRWWVLARRLVGYLPSAGGAALVSIAALAACSLLTPTLTRPSIEVVNIALRGGNVLQQNFAITLSIHNPNDRALPVRSVRASLKVGADEVATGVSDRPFVVAAHGESQFDMSIQTNMGFALVRLADQLNQPAIDYELSGAANLDLAFLHEVPFHQSGSFSLDQIR